MELAPVAFLTILVAIAGPVGITLGWWLGKRSERERTAREERKSAYVAFTTAAIQYRNSDDDERRQRRNERWEAFAVLTLVAPPPMVQIAAYLVAAGDKLLDPDSTLPGVVRSTPISGSTSTDSRSSPAATCASMTATRSRP